MREHRTRGLDRTLEVRPMSIMTVLAAVGAGSFAGLVIATLIRTVRP